MIESISLFSMKEEDYRVLYEAFALNAEGFISKTAARDYKLNDDAFADAIVDIEQDLSIIAYRRLKQVQITGISKGKVAGIYAFRLSRAPIIQFCPGQSLTNHPLDKSTNTAVALKTALDVVSIAVSAVPPALLKELIYNLRKRHMNQETLALVIDALVA